MTRQAYIYDAVRTPRGKGQKGGGALHRATPLHLANTVLQELCSRYPDIAHKTDQVIMGCFGASLDQGHLFHRGAVLSSGYSATVPVIQINGFSGGGLETIGLSACKVIAGSAELMITAGLDSPSRSLSHSVNDITFANPSLTFDHNLVSQGIMADLLATQRGYSTSNLEEVTLSSHQKAGHAHAQKWFESSLIPVKDQNEKVLLDHDEMVKPYLSSFNVSALLPAFSQSGYDDMLLETCPDIETISRIHTHATTAPVADGAGAILIGSKGIGKSLGIEPCGVIRSFASTACHTQDGFDTLIQSCEKALATARLTKDDIDIWEIHENFASTLLMASEDLDIHPDRLNRTGGSLAMGDCLSTTGIMLVSMAMDTLRREDKKLAVIAVSGMGNMASSLIIERI